MAWLCSCRTSAVIVPSPAPLTANTTTDTTVDTTADPNSKKYFGAGVVFASRTHILGGYQPTKSRPGISGIGGGRQIEDISSFYTAWREAIEELFGVHIIPSDLIQNISKFCETIPTNIAESNGYIMYRYDLNILPRILVICKKHIKKSPFYSKFPQTLIELIENRVAYDLKLHAELTHLCLLPVVNHVAPTPFLEKNFQADIIAIWNKNNTSI